MRLLLLLRDDHLQLVLRVEVRSGELEEQLVVRGRAHVDHLGAHRSELGSWRSLGVAAAVTEKQREHARGEHDEQNDAREARLRAIAPLVVAPQPVTWAA